MFCSGILCEVIKKQFIHKYARCKGLKQQTQEQKVAKKYNLILRKLDRWYVKMDKDIYPELTTFIYSNIIINYYSFVSYINYNIFIQTLYQFYSNIISILFK